MILMISKQNWLFSKKNMRTKSKTLSNLKKLSGILIKIAIYSELGPIKSSWTVTCSIVHNHVKSKRTWQLGSLSAKSLSTLTLIHFLLSYNAWTRDSTRVFYQTGCMKLLFFILGCQKVTGMIYKAKLLSNSQNLVKIYLWNLYALTVFSILPDYSEVVNGLLYFQMVIVHAVEQTTILKHRKN